MMTKADHIAHWLREAEQNWQEVQQMFAAGTYIPCLFWAHLTLEKIAKALWIQHNEANFPPFIHKITRLLELADVELTSDQMTFFQQLDAFQLQGRYEGYAVGLRQRATPAFTHAVLQQAAVLRQCLLEKLP